MNDTRLPHRLHSGLLFFSCFKSMHSGVSGDREGETDVCFSNQEVFKFDFADIFKVALPH